MRSFLLGFPGSGAGSKGCVGVKRRAGRVDFVSVPEAVKELSVCAGFSRDRQLSRRGFLSFCVAGVSAVERGFAQTAAGRKVELQLTEGFEESGPQSVLAVLSTTADTLWRHCARTTWNVPGFSVFRSPNAPITLHRHRPDGRVAIGLTASHRFWCQYAFQFAHEFAHALAGHSNDWRDLWVGDHGANQWFEEALCETASLFALLTLAKDWALQPPFENWRSFASKHEEYVRERLGTLQKVLPDPGAFAEWFSAELPSLREAGAQREKNLVVARQLLPLFQAHPAGWEALTHLNRVRDRDLQKRFGKHLADWSSAAPREHRPFLLRLREVFPPQTLAI